MSADGQAGRRTLPVAWLAGGWLTVTTAFVGTSFITLPGDFGLTWDGVVVALCSTILVASPVWISESDDRSTLDISELALVVALVELEPMDALLTCAIGHAAGWLLGLPRAVTRPARLNRRRAQQGTISVTTNVLGTAAGVWTFVAVAPRSPAEAVMVAVAAAGVALVLTDLLLLAAMTLGRPIAIQPTLLMHARPIAAVLGASGLLGAMIGLSGQSLGGAGLWLVLTTGAAALLSLAQTRRTRRGNYLTRIVEAAEQFTPSLDVEELRQRLCSLCARALHADSAELRAEPPQDTEIGRYLHGAEAWLVVTGRRGLAGRFTRNDERLLAGITGIAEVSLRNAQLHDELEHLAIRDELTGLLSRRGLRELFEQVRASADRDRHRLVVAFLDVDRFKAVNDTYGHERGDQLIQEIAGRLREVARDSDLLCRLGGDEFVIVGEDRDGQTASALHRRLRTAFAQAFAAAGDIDVGASLGMAVYPDDADTLDRLLTASDAAMYADKQRRR